MAKKPTTALIPEQAIGAWIALHRKPAETLAAFAKRIGTTRQTLFDVIAGRRQPGPKLIPLLAPLGLEGLEKAYRVKT